jgi:hypothetical protein
MTVAICSGTMITARALLDAPLVAFEFQIGVTPGKADRNVGNKWFDEPLPIAGIDAGADGA